MSKKSPQNTAKFKFKVALEGITVEKVLSNSQSTANWIQATLESGKNNCFNEEAESSLPPMSKVDKSETTSIRI